MIIIIIISIKVSYYFLQLQLVDRQILLCLLCIVPSGNYMYNFRSRTSGGIYIIIYYIHQLQDMSMTLTS